MSSIDLFEDISHTDKEQSFNFTFFFSILEFFPILGVLGLGFRYSTKGLGFGLALRV